MNNPTYFILELVVLLSSRFFIHFIVKLQFLIIFIGDCLITRWRIQNLLIIKLDNKLVRLMQIKYL